MKATEILAMIEEAAGTRMFEDRKDKAFKTMAKKNKKIDEIVELLKEEIEPKLEKLRSEKRAFLDFQQTQTDMERLQKLVIASDYVRSKERLGRSGADLEAKKARIKGIEGAAERMKSEIEHLEADKERVVKQREKELRKGGKFQALEKEVKEKSHELVRLQTSLDMKAAELPEEKKKIKAAEQAVKDQERLVKEKSAEFEKLQEQYNETKKQFDQESKEAEEKEELLQTLLTGVASKAGQENGYQGQLQEAKSRLNSAQTEQEQAKLKISSLEKRIREDEPKAKQAKKQNEKLFQDLDKLKNDASRIEQQLSSLGYEEGREREMKAQISELQDNIRELKMHAEHLRRKTAGVDFQYSDPSPNFDRSKVKGLVAQLFTLDKDKLDAGTALEICAGGRLYNVVVDSEVTGTQLLQRGQLKKRVTIIPLNKIQAFKASAQVCSLL